MNTTQREIQALVEATDAAQSDAIHQLSELELLLVAGGTGATNTY